MISAQSRELQTLLAGQIARALAVFCVDEVVIFDDGDFKPKPTEEGKNGDVDHDVYTGYTDPNYFLAHILSYLECPPYLRKALFPRHPDLQHAGMLPSLDMPHHLKAGERCEFREGVTKDVKPGAEPTKGTLAETGLEEAVYLDSTVPQNSRVTVRMESGPRSPGVHEAVAPSVPKEEKGWYWGYNVRMAESLSSVLTECPFEGGYDLTFGTSERGKPISELADGANMPTFRHMMLVFGGVAGLEKAVKADVELIKLGLEGPESLFDYWVNLVPNQGSRTVRTEEAIWLGLMATRDVALANGQG